MAVLRCGCMHNSGVLVRQRCTGRRDQQPVQRCGRRLLLVPLSLAPVSPQRTQRRPHLRFRASRGRGVPCVRARSAALPAFLRHSQAHCWVAAQSHELWAEHLLGPAG